jgi:rhamnosyltransferase
MPLIAQTLEMLRKQDSPHEILAFDNDSTDGTLEKIKTHLDRIINIPQGTYIPGRVLNKAMVESHGEYVVFLNSDCTPQNSFWLANLLKGFHNGKVAAVFGRQIPRPDCMPLFAKDTEDTYGDGRRQKLWRHCFSMASSAIRRSVWEKMKFNENISYSEDIEWTWRARQMGYSIQYVADSATMHSHNFSLMEFYARNYGEGGAEAKIFNWQVWERSWLRYSLFPYFRQVLSDWNYSLRKPDPASFFYSPVLRMAQLLGRRAGFISAFKDGTDERRLR